VAGALPPDEQAKFSQHTKSCGVCAEEARAFEEGASWMPLASHGVAAPPHLRDKLLARIQEPDPPPGIQVIARGRGRLPETLDFNRDQTVCLLYVPTTARRGDHRLIIPFIFADPALSPCLWPQTTGSLVVPKETP
jgi:hypothetical protein